MALMMGVAVYSEMSANFHNTALVKIPQDSNHRTHRGVQARRVAIK
jgi:hypothetical protein